ncbi:heme lyase CcmF/NrfE family subunit [Parvibaculum sp.]|jgi:cytochrome c-type biogenesis protein CcmF|uniref:heme lyase CcmF/NrfE family subunit n=1 Tax=Parvibaculum sp. TaxID=2024848 RepID=UPI000C4D912F|nr:heme lyase CcmF/NrfE family subunit [Parvibaculum sp.]MAM95305.1 heme lyase NrfEFG subunit NrfE [Parvibaculum sp.]HCX68203.1 heme lyase NrfEFG subunit NrfE [Rhodobiaceae bacterium]|tara:strand:+ start:5235 stop:7211 length:1977 start_codon:yes stop_codon:yes gene_type:complete
MIAELGHFALVLAFVVSLVQMVVPMVGAHRRDAQLIGVATPAALLQFLLVAFAFGALLYLFIVSDFSVKLVFDNSHSEKPMIFKISGVWGNHEGSMVLWVLILALFGALVALFGKNLPDTLRARVLAVQASIAVAFLLFILLTSNPFLRLDPAPFEGSGLNPILQDRALAFHPPWLYAGYVGFSMTFSFAIAALIEGKVDAAWARWVRPWTLAAWLSLTIGIAMGSWWAYYTLGWGGFWFWDPVENASLMPWIAGTALLHSAIVAEKRGALKSWTILLAILAFSLSLLGTFLVRSGVLTSVHAFAVDPDRGVFILGILVVFVGGSLALYAWRAPLLKTGGIFAPISREGALLMNNLLLSAAVASVFIGTLYPLLLDGLTGAKITVGPPFFNYTFVPIFVPLLCLVPLGPLLGWKRADVKAAAERLIAAAALAFIACLVTFAFAYDGPWLAPFGIGLAVWLVVGAASEIAWRIRLFTTPLRESLYRARRLPRAAWGTSLAHGGLGIVVAGIVGVTAWQSELITTLAPGESAEIAGYTLTLERVGMRDGPNYEATVGVVRVEKAGRMIATLTPEKRRFPAERQEKTEPAIRTNGLADLYVVLGEPSDDGKWVVRAYHNILAPWIWIGGAIMALGGIMSLADRRLRVGAPTRARLRAAPAE